MWYSYVVNTEHPAKQWGGTMHTRLCGRTTRKCSLGIRNAMLEASRGPFSGSHLPWGSLRIGRVWEDKEGRGWEGRGACWHGRAHISHWSWDKWQGWGGELAGEVTTLFFYPPAGGHLVFFPVWRLRQQRYRECVCAPMWRADGIISLWAETLGHGEHTRPASGENTTWVCPSHPSCQRWCLPHCQWHQ